MIPIARANDKANPATDSTTIARRCQLSEKARKDSSVASPSLSAYASFASCESSGPRRVVARRGERRDAMLLTAGMLSRATRPTPTAPITKEAVSGWTVILERSERVLSYLYNLSGVYRQGPGMDVTPGVTVRRGAAVLPLYVRRLYFAAGDKPADLRHFFFWRGVRVRIFNLESWRHVSEATMWVLVESSQRAGPQDGVSAGDVALESDEVESVRVCPESRVAGRCRYRYR